MPKAICKRCGRVWHGWALKYKACFCDCGEKLEIIKDNLKLGRTKEPQKFIDEFAKKAFGRSKTEAEEKQVCVSVVKKSKCLASGMSYLRESIKSRAFVKKCQDKTF